MSRSVVLLLFLLTACASQPINYYANVGPVTATIKYNGVSEFPYHKEVWLSISREDEPCQWNDLGFYKVQMAGDKIHLPTGKPVLVEVVMGANSVLSNNYKRKSVIYRFQVSPKESYVFEIVDNGRSQGFQVYRSGGGRVEVPFIPAMACKESAMRAHGKAQSKVN